MFRLFIISVVSKMSRLLGGISFPYLKKELDGQDYYEALKYIKEGMVLVTKTNGYLSNSLIPGFWGHAAIYVNPAGGNPSIVEATEKGVTRTDLITFLLTKDVAAIYEPRFASNRHRALAANTATGLIGKPYDYSFQGNNEAFYCSELVWHSYNQVLGKDNPFALRERYGYMTIAPDDFANADDKWSKVWQSKSYKNYFKDK